ncbi:MAG: VWA domain-containing protein [Desulfobacteraceae bacterium]|nr:MAG: VWA domain-containing protein [Desulfobacteraceae bacterium]
MHFESPWSFLLLLLIPVLLWIRHRRAVPGSVHFPTIAYAGKSGQSIRGKFIWIPLFLRVLALVFLVIALARPQTGTEQIRDVTQGIAIEMVVDRSGSMGQEMEYRGEKMNRLEVVKRVFREFALGNDDDLKGRPSDLIGIISFARYPDTTCPLTLAHGAIPAFIDSIRLVQTREEDGTAIGDALALAAARLEQVDETIAFQRQRGEVAYTINSKVIILLSDGENNRGKRSPMEAAELAAKWGIKVYTIAIGGGDSQNTIQTPFGVFQLPGRQGVDTDAMRAIAEKTKGAFYQAEDEKSLRTIYEQIDKMEKTEIESIKFIDYKEAFLPFVYMTLFLIGLEILLRETLFRRIP